MLCFTHSSLIYSVCSVTKVKKKTLEGRSWLMFHIAHRNRVVSRQFASVQGIPHISEEHPSFSAIGNHLIDLAQLAPLPGSFPWFPPPASPQVSPLYTSHPHLYRGSYYLYCNCLFTFQCPPLECELGEGQDCATFLILISSPASVPSAQ